MLPHVAWLRFALFVACFAFAGTAGLAQTQAGAIKAVRVSGDVTRLDSAGAASPVTEGQALIESDTIVTGPNAGVVLVFMNGSSVKLAANSRLAIEEFKMDPLGQDIAVAAMKEEPSVSRTRLNLAYGDLVGNVKKLKSASTFDVKTPVGAAGIRGTTFRIVLRFESDGRVAFTLSTAEGRVVFAGSVPGSAATAPGPTGATPGEVEVSAGTEVSATVEINPANNQVTSIQVSAPAAISPQATQAIDAAIASAISQATQSTIFTATEQQRAAEQTQPAINPAAGAESTSPATPAATQPGTTTPAQVLDTSARSPSG